MVDGYDTLMLSFIAPLISKDWALAPGAFGAIFASSYAGAALGATTIGWAADRFGRKAMLLTSLAIAAVFSVASAWASGPSQLMLLRAFAGIGLGGAIPTMSALAAMHAAPGRRSATVTRMFLGYPVGAMMGGAITAAVMLSIGWRGVLLAGGICASLLVPLVAFGITESATPDSQAIVRVQSQHPLAELVSDGRGLGTVLLCAAVFLVLLVSYFLVSWTPTVLVLNGTSPQRSALAGVVLNLGGLVGGLILSWLVGRRSPLVPIAGCLGAGALLITLLGQGVLAAESATVAVVFVVGILVIGAQLSFPALSVHFYPPTVSATGVGLSMACGRLGSIAGPLVGGYLLAAGTGWNWLFLLAALPAAVAALALVVMAAKSTSRAPVLPQPPEDR